MGRICRKGSIVVEKKKKKKNFKNLYFLIKTNKNILSF